MRPRIACRAAIAGAALLAGCSGDAGQAGGSSASASEQSAAPGAASDGEFVEISCALDGAAQFSSNCAVERAQVDGALILVVRHPDGGFRRFQVVDDGHGLVTADGAHQALLALSGKVLEASVGDDRYRFPVTLTGDGAQP